MNKHTPQQKAQARADFLRASGNNDLFNTTQTGEAGECCKDNVMAFILAAIVLIGFVVVGMSSIL